MTIHTIPARSDRAVDYAAIELEARRMRAEAMRRGAATFADWVRSNLHLRRQGKSSAKA